MAYTLPDGRTLSDARRGWPLVAVTRPDGSRYYVTRYAAASLLRWARTA